jgi:hypothetical protein
MKTAFILIDALGAESISYETTPHILDIFNKGQKRQLKTILGYSSAAIPSILSGVYPDKHERWNSFVKSEKKSPFHLFKILAPVDRIKNRTIRRLIKSSLSMIIQHFNLISGYDTLDIHDIPIKFIEQFDNIEKVLLPGKTGYLDYPTIFELLNKKKVEYTLTGFPKKIEEVIKDIKKGDNTDFIYVYVSDYDSSSHQYGVHSEQNKKSLLKIDHNIHTIHKAIQSKWGNDFNLILASDHGMSDIKYIFNVEKDILGIYNDHKGEFTYFLDSTMARFWYNNEDIKKIIQAKLKSYKQGILLNEEQKITLHIPNNIMYGEDIFVVKDNTLIFPNFLNLKIIKGMHGYLPENSSQNGVFFIKHSKNNIPEMVNLIDILPTIFSSLNIITPRYCNGNNYFYEEK